MLHKRVTYTGAFAIGDQVYLDGDGDILAHVTKVSFDTPSGDEATYEVCWLHQGSVQSTWCRAHRLAFERPSR